MHSVKKIVLILAALFLTATGYSQDASTNKWEKSAGIGLTLTKGNSDTIMFTADALATRKWTSDELSLGASASYGEQEDVKNNETVKGFGQWNHLFTERFYSYVRVDALHDAIADVDYRVTLSPGAGYYFIKQDNMHLSGEVGPGVVFEKQGGVEKTYFTARVAEKFDYKFNDRARMWQMVEFLPQVDNLDNYIINAEIGVEASITKKTALRAVIQDTYDNQPAPGREKNDLKLVSSFVVKF
jgi:putative salt-induced outer membrane protein YdiY